LKANEFRGDSYVQPLAYFGGGIPGYLAVLERPGEIVITARPSASELSAPKVVHCNISSWNRISDNVMPPRAKAITNYQNSRYVSTESRVNGYDFGIILNSAGKVSEASYACIFICQGRRGHYPSHQRRNSGKHNQGGGEGPAGAGLRGVGD